MTKRPLIQAVGNHDEQAPNEFLLNEEFAEESSNEAEFSEPVGWYEEPETSRDWTWVLPAVCLTTIALWTVFFGWAHRANLVTLPSAETAIDLIAQWAIPVLLVATSWLLAMRNSTREAKRFSAVAQTLSTQSAELETRLATINRELSLAREFLSSQTKDLDYLGRSATERISEHAERLQGLIAGNGEQVESIARVSVTALENMDRLRDNLPVIANSARDVSNQIGSAGRTAQSQLEELIGGFERLNEFGAASERQVASLRKRVDLALESFAAQADRFGEIAGQRFVALREESEAYRSELESREVEALAAIRGRFDAIRDELASTEAATALERETASEALRERIESLRAEAAEIAQTVRAGEAEAIAAWQGQIEAMQLRLQEAVSEVTRIDEAALTAANAKLRELFAEAEAIDRRMAERNRLFAEDMTRRQDEFSAAEEDARNLLGQRLAALDENIASRRTAQMAQLTAMVAEGETLAERIGSLAATFETVASQGREARDVLTQGVTALTAVLVDSREALDGTDMAVSALTDASVRLLELIQASAKQGRDDLPAAMEASETRLANIERRADEVKGLLDQARLAGAALTASIDAADERSRQAIAGVDAFQSRFGLAAEGHGESVEQLRANLAVLGEESAAISERAQTELRAAIATLETTAREALTAIESEQAERIAHIADKVGERSAEAIDKAVAEHTALAISRLDEATIRSSEAGREITRQLRDQLAKVNELTGNLESRIAHARDRATEEVDNDFSRRVALITESLNSTSIDIAKALSTEITDTAWASYLRGDRGIFTRRAVRMLDNSEAREIAELYDTDRDFREHVSRYIHDFEAMLRTMLSTRDGNAMSVTLLSSDMGKLYVVLAQALERLRQ